MWLNNISTQTHKLIRGKNCSWCAYAWQKRLDRGWSPLVFIMGKKHCRESWKKYF